MPKNLPEHRPLNSNIRRNLNHFSNLLGFFRKHLRTGKQAGPCAQLLLPSLFTRKIPPCWWGLATAPPTNRCGQAIREHASTIVQWEVNGCSWDIGVMCWGQSSKFNTNRRIKVKVNNWTCIYVKLDIISKFILFGGLVLWMDSSIHFRISIFMWDVWFFMKIRYNNKMFIMFLM